MCLGPRIGLAQEIPGEQINTSFFYGFRVACFCFDTNNSIYNIGRNDMYNCHLTDIQMAIDMDSCKPVFWEALEGHCVFMLVFCCTGRFKLVFCFEVTTKGRYWSFMDRLGPHSLFAGALGVREEC